MHTDATRRDALPLQRRAINLQPSTFNRDALTVEVVWTSGARVRRHDFWTGTDYDEELAVEPAAVDMTRFEAGAVQVLDSHDRSGVASILGIAERAWIKDGQGHALLRLSQRPEVAGIVGDIGAGIIRDVSFGYSVQRYEVTRAADRTDGGGVDLWRAIRWTPQEISFVPVPADPLAGTRSAPDTFPVQFQRHQATMTTTTAPSTGNTTGTTGNTVDATYIKRHCGAAGLPADFANGLIARGLDRAGVASAIVEELARRDDAAGGHLNVSPYPHERTPFVEAATTALVRRATGAQIEASNPYRHARLADLARECLERAGKRTTSMSPDQLIRAGLHSTSDFPNLLQNTGERVLRNSYMSYQGGLKRICRASTVRDFRAKSILQLGEAPRLLPVNEHGEFTSGSMAEARESYRLVTYGRLFGITRQALINDDLQAFGQVALKIGRAAAEVEAQTLVNLLTSNPTMGDGIALFHASHNNLLTGAPSALSLTSLTNARRSMRLQRGLDGTTPIDATPRFLVVPAALETTAEQLVTQLTPANTSDVNPFAGRLEVVVEPRLDAISATAWYLASDPAMLDTIEYAHLEGVEGPEVFTMQGWEVDGVEMKGRLDFGAGVLDWRGLVRAVGA
jgi:hypothetical protein